MNTSYVVSILVPFGNEYIPFSHREFSSYKAACEYKQHMIANGHMCKLTSL
jgi:hypothetical protein